MVKVVRSFPAPASLAEEAKKAHGEYNKPDVIERLKKVFDNKCYICEMKELQDPNVEHLLPHKNGKYLERKFDWENLFWACGHCNSVKNNGKYDEGIVDCCKLKPLHIKMDQGADCNCLIASPISASMQIDLSAISPGTQASFALMQAYVAFFSSYTIRQKGYLIIPGVL